MVSVINVKRTGYSRRGVIGAWQVPPAPLYSDFARGLWSWYRPGQLTSAFAELRRPEGVVHLRAQISQTASVASSMAQLKAAR